METKIITILESSDSIKDKANELIKLFESEINEGDPIACPVCQSLKTYKTLAIHCDRCAVTTEI